MREVGPLWKSPSLLSPQEKMDAVFLIKETILYYLRRQFDMKSIWLLFSLICVQATFGSDEEKIVGGQEANAKAYPWEVSLGNLMNVPSRRSRREQQSKEIKLDAHFCDGVLIHKRFVLTAAHCLIPYMDDGHFDAPAFGAGIGGRDLIEMYDDGRFPIIRAIIPSGYDATDGASPYDIALLQLESSVDSTPLACLSKRQRRPHHHLLHHFRHRPPLKAVGWGNTQPMIVNLYTHEMTGLAPSATLKEAWMMDVSRAAPSCATRPDLLCVSPVTQGDAICLGDSGGALLSSSETVVGIASFGIGRNLGNNKYSTCEGDAVYTHVPDYIEWIETEINSTLCTR